MTFKRKRTVKPNSTLHRRPSSLPTQYEFVPRATTSASVPPVPPKNHQPSVKDYPPPRVLFSSTTFPPSGSLPVAQSQARQPSQAPQSSPGEATSMPQPEARQSPSPSHQGAPSPPLQRASSPHSSQAQNSHSTVDPTDSDDDEPLVEPDLSQNVMNVLNSMLDNPGREEYTTVLSRNLEPGTTW